MDRPRPGRRALALLMSVHPADQLVASNSAVRPSRTALAISPDGRRVVFSATHGTVTQLYVRGLDQVAATPVPGTEDAIGPLFSPNGEWIRGGADARYVRTGHLVYMKTGTLMAVPFDA